jgi:hypothetical protein
MHESDPSANPAPTGINPAALELRDAAKLLGISEAMLREDLLAGAPSNADGTLNLVRYAAWLNLEMHTTDGS